MGNGICSSRDADALGQPFVDGASAVGGFNHDDNNDEDLGVDEADELVGQLVDYVSDLTLLP